jgi:hypothetical protein
MAQIVTHLYARPNDLQEVNMNNAQIRESVGIDPVVLESVNQISGAHAAFFWDMFYGTSESIIAIENMKTVLAFLYNGDNFTEAFMLIRSYYELLGIDWPDEMAIIEKIDELKEPFVYEFLLDAEDIILDFKYDEDTETLNQRHKHDFLSN